LIWPKYRFMNTGCSQMATAARTAPPAAAIIGRRPAARSARYPMTGSRIRSATTIRTCHAAKLSGLKMAKHAAAKGG
jgi:cytochrome c5